MQLDAWLAAAQHDADRRNLPELKTLLETLARATAALRAADEQYRQRVCSSNPREPAR